MSFKKGDIPWNKGKLCSEEHKQKISISQKGKNTWSKGRKLSEETIIKMSIACRGRNTWSKGRKLSDETKRKMSEANRGRKLRHEFGIGDRNPSWRGGSSFEPYSPSFNQQLKDRIRVRDNFICQHCGIPELECNTRLHIHHIDYNKKNSNIDNLISLCVSCHAKTYWNKKVSINGFANPQGRE